MHFEVSEVVVDGTRQTPGDIERSEARLRKILDESLAGIAVVRGGEVFYRNPAYDELLAGMNGLLELDDQDCLYPEDAEDVRSFRSRLTSGEIEAGELDFRFFRPLTSGASETVWVHCRATRVEFAGAPAILFNLLDISRSKELEQFLTVDDKMTSLGRMAAAVGHDVRNALSSLNLYLTALEGVLAGAQVPERAGELIARLKGCSQRIENTFTTVRDFARPSEPETVRSDLNEEVRRVSDMCASALSEAGAALELSLAAERLPCHLDRHSFSRVLVNLLNNAADAVRGPGGAVSLATWRDDDRVVVSISDSGRGVPAHLRADVFDPFFTTKTDGTGIGLSISHRIVSDHGGVLYVRDGELGGAEFVVELPVDKDRVLP